MIFCSFSGTAEHTSLTLTASRTSAHAWSNAFEVYSYHQTSKSFKKVAVKQKLQYKAKVEALPVSPFYCSKSTAHAFVDLIFFALCQLPSKIFLHYRAQTNIHKSRVKSNG